MLAASNYLSHEDVGSCSCRGLLKFQSPWCALSCCCSSLSAIRGATSGAAVIVPIAAGACISPWKAGLQCTGVVVLSCA